MPFQAWAYLFGVWYPKTPKANKVKVPRFIH